MLQLPPQEPTPENQSLSWDDVLFLVSELKIIARRLLAKEDNAGSVQTTDLVNRALEKVGKREKQWREVVWADREKFFKDTYFAMRRVLATAARDRGRRKEVKAGSFESEQVNALVTNRELNLDRLMDAASDSSELADAISRALDTLEQQDPETASIVQHRAFSGLGQDEIAKLMGISIRTVRTREKLGYALLRQELVAFFPAA